MLSRWPPARSACLALRERYVAAARTVGQAQRRETTAAHFLASLLSPVPGHAIRPPAALALWRARRALFELGLFPFLRRLKLTERHTLLGEFFEQSFLLGQICTQCVNLLQTRLT